MFRKILIANRGEIAVRIISTAKEMGIKTVAVYSDFDKYSLYAKIADEAYHIGEPQASKSYLDGERIITAAKKSGCDAIHPGYGFLSEREFFAQMCADNGIKFIGPPPAAIGSLGSKTHAKQIAVANSVPVVPGTESAIKDIDEAKSISKKIGYPVMIKASAGGGGKGMRVVRSESDLESALRMAQNEARSSFGDDSVFIEKYVDAPRHIEFQILVDEHGNAVHLGERECSMQRRHQKIIEETPSVIMDDDLRYRMGEAAKRMALASGYTNAGTCEFMVDKDKNFYFLEVNTRLQVEHPITEMRTGIDLVEQQLRIASGEKLSFTQDDVKFNGYAIECRICAEDPDNNFLPSTGKIRYLSRVLGNGMREDTGIEQGNEISIYYDSMISKLIAYGHNRKSAIEKMKRVLKDYKITGLKTNTNFLLELLGAEEYINGEYDTQYVERTFLPRHLEKKVTIDNESNLVLALSAAIFKEANDSVPENEMKRNSKKTNWVSQRNNIFR